MGLGALVLEGQVIMCVSLKFLWNEAALIIFMANHLFHPGLGFVLWLIGSVPGAAAVQLGFSTSGLRVNKYLLVRKKRRELRTQYHLKFAVTTYLGYRSRWFYHTRSYL